MIVLLLHIVTYATNTFAQNYSANTYFVDVDNTTHLETIVYTHHGQNNRSLAVIFEQTPYSDPRLISGIVATWLSFVEQVNVSCRLVVQLNRGTGNSSGAFDGLSSVSYDGALTVSWILQRPWCNGVVLRFGASAMGMAVYMQARNPPQPVRAGFAAVATANLHNTLYHQGTFRFDLAHFILGYIGKPDYIEIFESHEAQSDPWWGNSTLTTYSNVLWPGVHVAGWFDPFLSGQLEAYEGDRSKSAKFVRAAQILRVAPQGHCAGGGQFAWSNEENAFLGEGMASSALLFKVFADSVTNDDFALALDVWQLLTARVPRVTWWVMGPGFPYNTTGHFAVGADSFPNATATSYYLQPNSGLGSIPSVPSTISYLYNPSNPLPNLGGNTFTLSDSEGHTFCGPWDQLLLGPREDVLQFQTQPLQTDLFVTGAVSVILHVSSNTSDTDFMAKLVDVYPNGTRLLVCDSAIRMRWRNASSTEPQLMKAGQVYRVVIDLWHTAFAFPVGHRIGLDVTSSNFPKYTANPNNGLNLTGKGPLLTAKNTVHFGGVFDSQLILPIVQANELKRIESPIFPSVDEIEEAKMRARLARRTNIQ
eukprot:TRINITY_DN10218_c0_g1_i1.p1 TRINITY_DN10218_c0_g1~~TRINITY_DN10218_c0_g1_i1.p1  ORF type:complete len:605 (+),score=61.21 TRINITY_DN10218_c0_g1_i1:45-1817(+)